MTNFHYNDSKTVRVVETQAEYVESPLECDSGTIAHKFRVPYFGDSADEAEDILEVVFRSVYASTGDEDKALRAARLYAYLSNDERELAISHYRGYSQSDWADILYIYPRGAQWADGLIKVHEEWLRGDVWSLHVELATTCECCGNTEWELSDGDETATVYGWDNLDKEVESMLENTVKL